MTKEDKELLLKDLCARLPYGVRLHINSDLVYKDDTLLGIDLIEGLTPYITHNKIISVHSGYSYSLEEVKPYLRSMLSMTEEEKKEYRKTQITKWVKSVDCTHGGYYEHRDTFETFDWFNVHHFDYRGLIDKGLALEAPEGMYNLKEK